MNKEEVNVCLAELFTSKSITLTRLSEVVDIFCRKISPSNDSEFTFIKNGKNVTGCIRKSTLISRLDIMINGGFKLSH